MSIEETIRTVLREELERVEERLAKVAAVGAAAALGDEERLLPLEEAERLYGYSPETIKKWQRAGHLTRYGRGRSCRVSDRELRRFLTPGAAPTTRLPPSDGEIIELARQRATRRR